MSLVSSNLSSISIRILRQPSYGFKKKQQRHRFAGSRLPMLRVVSGQPSPSQELEIRNAPDLNEAAPPVSNVFGDADTTTSTTKEVSILDDPAGFLYKRVERKVQKVEQALQAVGETVSPSPFSPSQGNDVVGFFLISVFLSFIFWVGNYFIPTWIFKDTVFRQRNRDDEDEERRRRRRRKAMEDEVDPADLIELPTNLQPFRGFAVDGFKAGRQRARDEAEAKRRKESGESK